LQSFYRSTQCWRDITIHAQKIVYGNTIFIKRIIIIIIFCSSGNVDAQSTPLTKSCPRSLWSLQITITLTEATLLIFLQYGVEKLLVWVAGDQTHNLRCQLDAYDLSAKALNLEIHV